MQPSPLRALYRAFCAQWLSSDAPNSDRVARQRIVLILTCLVAPGMFLLVSLYPDFAGAYYRATHHRAPMSIIDDRLEWIAFLLTTYSMVGTGFITVLVWESLTFSRLDAMILGPLPIRPVTTLMAKFGALGALLAIGAAPIGVLQATFFTLETAEPPSITRAASYFSGILIAILAAALFAFAAIVAIRAATVFVAGARTADALGPPLQFLFILGLLSLVFLSPAFWQSHVITENLTNALPPVWFVGLFERLRGSPRAYDPAFATHFRLAVSTTPAAVIVAVMFSMLTFRSQMRLALMPVARHELAGTARLRRALARIIAGRSQEARATADFVLLTLARSNVQQGPMAIAGAVGAAIVIASLTHQVHSIGGLFQARMAVLWIPLVVGYWIVIGLRQSFNTPSELRAAWMFRIGSTGHAAYRLAGVRAATLAAVVAPMLVATMVMYTPLVGWRIAIWHVAVTGAVLSFLCEVMLLTVDFIPFTRSAQSSGRLRVLWPVYVIGLIVFAVIPSRMELSLLHTPRTLAVWLAVVVGAVALIGAARSGVSATWAQADDADEEIPFEGITVLNIGG